MKEYLKTIGLSLIPAFLVYIGKTDSFFIFLQKHDLIAKVDFTEPQLYCFIIGFLWASLITPVQLASKKNKLELKTKQYDELLAFNKETYFKSIKETLKKHNKSFNTRLFVPCKGFRAWWNKQWNEKISFTLKEFKGISDPLNTKTLHFDVLPTTQGLVGKACKEKAIIVDCQVQPDKYNLTYYQVSKTHDVKFCSTAPIFNSNNDVIAVLSVDSNDDIQFDDNELKQWKNLIIYYCAFVDKHLKF
ncbi:MAG TPA: hypothetical protein PK809_14915 [Bacteroidia bacterium]|nr:hypothetical protein [Bacteroidia bacterium]